MTGAEAKVRRRGGLGAQLRGQLAMLALQFVLGMAVNLIGEPSEATGVAKAATATFLVLHVLLAVGLLVGAVRIVLATRSGPLSQLGWATGGTILVTFGLGVATMITDNDLLSFLMAVGFIASFLGYGMMLLRAPAAADPR